MADETPLDALRNIKRKLMNLHHAIDELHDALRDGLVRHGHLLVDPGEVQPLAGEPKLPPGGGGGS